MILGINEVRKKIISANLITNLAKRELNNPEGTIIDLRLDKLYELKGDGYLGIKERKTPKTIEVATYDPDNLTKYIVKPGEYLLSKTVEEVNLPHNVGAIFKPRSTLFRSGVFFRSGFANPGYKGALYFGIYNAGGNNFTFEMGARYCSIIFLEIKGKIENLYRGQWQGGRAYAEKLEKQI